MLVSRQPRFTSLGRQRQVVIIYSQKLLKRPIRNMSTQSTGRHMHARSKSEPKKLSGRDADYDFHSAHPSPKGKDSLLPGMNKPHGQARPRCSIRPTSATSPKPGSSTRKKKSDGEKKHTDKSAVGNKKSGKTKRPPSVTQSQTDMRVVENPINLQDALVPRKSILKRTPSKTRLTSAKLVEMAKSRANAILEPTDQCTKEQQQHYDYATTSNRYSSENATAGKPLDESKHTNLSLSKESSIVNDGQQSSTSGESPSKVDLSATHASSSTPARTDASDTDIATPSESVCLDTDCSNRNHSAHRLSSFYDDKEESPPSYRAASTTKRIHWKLSDEEADQYNEELPEAIHEPNKQAHTTYTDRVCGKESNDGYVQHISTDSKGDIQTCMTKCIATKRNSKSSTKGKENKNGFAVKANVYDGFSRTARATPPSFPRQTNCSSFEPSPSKHVNNLPKKSNKLVHRRNSTPAAVNRPKSAPSPTNPERKRRHSMPATTKSSSVTSAKPNQYPVRPGATSRTDTGNKGAHPAKPSRRFREHDASSPVSVPHKQVPCENIPSNTHHCHNNSRTSSHISVTQANLHRIPDTTVHFLKAEQLQRAIPSTDSANGATLLRMEPRRNEQPGSHILQVPVTSQSARELETSVVPGYRGILKTACNAASQERKRRPYSSVSWAGITSYDMPVYETCLDSSDDSTTCNSSVVRQVALNEDLSTLSFDGTQPSTSTAGLDAARHRCTPAEPTQLTSWTSADELDYSWNKAHPCTKFDAVAAWTRDQERAARGHQQAP